MTASPDNPAQPVTPDHPTLGEIIGRYGDRLESLRWEVRYGDDIREVIVAFTLAPNETGTATQ